MPNIVIMVRGRRTRSTAIAGNRSNETDGKTITTNRNIINGFNGQVDTINVDDPYCASPKRKDCKLDGSIKSINNNNNNNKNQRKYRTNSKSNAVSTSCESPSIKNYFQVQRTKKTVRRDQLAAEEVQRKLKITEDYNIDDDACHAYPINNGNVNLFTMEPTLKLEIDKTPNQPSSIVINKSLTAPVEFDNLMPSNGFNCFTELKSERSSNINDSDSTKLYDITRASLNGGLAGKPKPIELEVLLNTDSNSCDSGVVTDRSNENGTPGRRKPTTPHRIVCPSPEKQITSRTLVAALRTSHKLEEANRRNNMKSRKRLIINQSENVTKLKEVSKNLPNGTQPKVNGMEKGEDITTEQKPIEVKHASPKKSIKPILNTTADPSAKQNTKNNKPSTKLVESKLTDFYPVRRSNRKTNRKVQEEKLRDFIDAICKEREDGLEVKDFGDKGRGVCATRLFKRGEFVVEYIGELIPITEANDRERMYAEDDAGCYMYYFKHKNMQYCIDATAETGKLGRLVNHSRNGNLVTKIVEHKNEPHLVLIAGRDIQTGEELTYDYGDRSKLSLQNHPWLAN